jgi:uncharacterized membrane protein
MTSATFVSSTGLPPRVAAPLAYAGWWITGLIVWFVEREDRYIRFHAAQSMTAFGLIAVLIGAFAMLAAVSLSFLPSAVVPFVWAAGLTWVGGLALWVLSMWKAATGDHWRIPIAADLAERLT